MKLNIYWKNGLETIETTSEVFVFEYENEKLYYKEKGFNSIEFIFEVFMDDAKFLNYYLKTIDSSVDIDKLKEIKLKAKNKSFSSGQEALYILKNNLFSTKEEFIEYYNRIDSKSKNGLLRVFKEAFWNKKMRLIYSTVNSSNLFKLLEEQDMLIPNSPIIDKLLGNNVVLSLEEEHIYYQFFSPNFNQLQLIEKHKFIEELKVEYEKFKIQIDRHKEENEMNIKEFEDKILRVDELNKKTMSNARNNIANLENDYKKMLQFDEPAKFWNEKSKEYVKLSRKWLLSAIIIGILLLISIVIIASFLFSVSLETGILNIEFSGIEKTITVNSIIIFTLLESVVIYILRTCLKYYDYYIKLSEFYKSKSMLSSFYVTIKSDVDIDNEIKRFIYKELFSIRDIKGDSVPAMEITGIASQK